MEETGKTKWTKRLIPELEPWIRRVHGAEHGGFGSYLASIRKKGSAVCEGAERGKFTYLREVGEG